METRTPALRSTSVALATMLLATLAAIPAAAAAQTCFGHPPTQVGTPRGDELHGTPGRDVLVGLGGNDRFEGLGGDDLLCGGPGSDYMSGGLGSDRIAGDDGDDRIASATGKDFLSGGDGDDYISGQAGADEIGGGDGSDQLLGGKGVDSVEGGPGDDGLTGDDACSCKNPPHVWNDTLNGGPGSDIAYFWVHHDATSGMTVDLAAGIAKGQGTDTVISVEGVVADSPLDDTLLGDGSNNLFSAGEGNDRSTGGGGDDTFIADGDDDDYSGGEGADTIDLRFAYGGAVVNLLSGSVIGVGNDQLHDVENVIGGFGDDIITGSPSPNVLEGASGQDVLRGGAGDDLLRGGLNDLYNPDRVDVLSGGPGDDFLDGGAPGDVDRDGKVIDGRDEVDYSTSSVPVHVDLGTRTATGEGNDTLLRIEDVVGSGFDDLLEGDGGANELDGIAGDDVLNAGGGDDEFKGSPGDDTIAGGTGLDSLQYNYSAAGVAVDLGAGIATGQGNDILTSIESLRGSIFDDHLTGDAGPNFIDGNLGDDTIDAGGGDDEVEGQRGDDVASGGDGIDSVFGMSGDDTLNGGAGNDTMDGGEDDDLVSGGEGDDVMTDQRGSDGYDGGPGIDLIDFSSSTQPLTLSLVTGIGEHEDAETVTTIENVIATSFEDELTGDDANNQLVGSYGLDKIEGGGGDDLILGSRGHDAIDGGVGTDTVSFADARRPVTVDLGAGFAQGSGQDTIVSVESVSGSSYSDYIRGDDGDNTLMGLGGDDVLEGRDGNDSLQGGDGADVGDGGPGTDSCTSVEFPTDC